jgi:WD40 repeat protein
VRPGVSRPLIALADAATQPEFSHDCRTLAVGLSDNASENSLCLFDLATGQPTKRVALDMTPERLAFHPDGDKLAISSTREHQVQVRDLVSGRILYALSHPAGVQAVAWHPEGRLLATGCDDRRIYLWDGINGARRGVLEGHSWEVHDLAFNQGGDWLASFGWDMTLRLWEVATGKPLWHLEDVRVVGFRREEPLQAAAISGRQVRVWTCVPSTEFRVLRGPAQNIRQVDVSPDGRYLACATYGGEGYFWDLRRQHEVPGFTGAQTYDWDPEGGLWFITEKGQLLHRPRSGTNELGPSAAELALPEPLEPGMVHVPWWLSWDRRLLLILSPAPVNQLRLFRMDGNARRLWARTVPNVFYGSISPDGRLATGTQDGGRGISILEAHSGKLIKELEIGDALPRFSPDGRWLITTAGRLTAPEGECALWRTDTWEKVRARPLRRSSSSPSSLQVSRDGALLAVAYTMNEVRLLRPETLEEIVTLTAPELGLVSPMQFSPDGRKLLVGVANTVHVWDLPALRRGLSAIGLDWEVHSVRGGGEK